jgi:hypothetical protein
MDRELAGYPGAVVPIVSFVFGGPVWFEGPTWIRDPAKETQDRFLAEVAGVLTAGDHVFVSRGRIPVASLRDVLGQPIPGLGFDAREAALFFIDHSPAANWAHRCTYVLVGEDGRLARAEHLWPPADDVELVRFPARARAQ